MAYSSGKLNSSSFDRYFDQFESVTILGRCLELDELADGCTLLSSQKIHFIPFDDLSSISAKYLRRKNYENKMNEIVRAYDGVVVRVPSELAFLAARTARHLHKPYICEVVACPFDAMIARSAIGAYLYAPIIRQEMKTCVRRASCVHYVTDRFLQLRYPTNSFSIAASNVEIEEVIYRNRSLNISQKKDINIALVGNLDSPHKGYPLVYKFASEAQRRFPDREFKIHLIGGGRRYKMLLPNLVYYGSCSKEEVFSILDRVDLYIQPSTQEGLPRATIEAMSRGLPCIVSDVGGLPELISEEFTHPAKNYNKMLDCVYVLINDDDVYWDQSRLNSENSTRYLNKELKVVRATLMEYYSRLLTGCV
jgi:glycosyltransferase involved in cell wall biosynthesis